MYRLALPEAIFRSSEFSKEKIHPLAKILMVADLFADFAIKGPHHPGMKGPAAMAHIEKLHADKFDKDVLKALKSIFVQGSDNRD